MVTCEQTLSGKENPFLSTSDAPSPRYHRLWLDLCRRFQSGEFPVGSLMPTEAGLCAEYKVGRITVRRALARLQSDRVLKRTQGKGSVVLRLPPAITGQGTPPERTEIAILAFDRDGVVSAAADDWGSNILRVTTGLFASEGFRCAILPFDAAGSQNLVDTTQRLEAMLPRLAGVLGIGSPVFDSLHDFFDRNGVPWITINPSKRTQTHNFVSAQNHEGGMRIGRLFADREVRTAIFFGPALDIYSTEEKFNGLLRGWVEKGRSICETRLMTIRMATRAQPDDLSALRELVRHSPGPHGIFCAGDILAAQAMRIFRETGLRVPSDVAVVGSTGLLLAEHTSPTLTVLSQPMAEMGAAAEELLLGMIRSGTHRVPGRFIPCPLTFRESCPDLISKFQGIH